MTNPVTSDPSAITLRSVRLSYPHLFVPRAYSGPGAQQAQSAPKFQTNILIPKTDKENLVLLQNAYKAAIAKVAATKFGGKVPADLRRPYYDGDQLTPTGKEPGEECKGHIVLSAKSSTKPAVYFKNTKTEARPEDAWAGQEAHVSVKLAVYTGLSMGVTAYLNAVLLLGRGERIDGRINPEEAFAGLEEEFTAGAGNDDDYDDLLGLAA